jgi:DNA polymerase-3 subunit epsilon
MVLLDCETTGGNATRNRIIEVGLLIIEDGKLMKRWQTFVDPEAILPPFIQKITGITPAMLVGAPVFMDVAEQLLQLIDGRTLVAHNARFDYGFLKNEFARVGITYTTKPLCSVKFSRALYPQFNRHGLSHIIKRFDLTIENRHRALDDAEMIYQFFLKSSALFSVDEISATCKQQQKRPALPMNLPSSEIDKLPPCAGVYYFYDSQGVLLYVGKSVHIRNRVMSHFNQDHKNPKDLQMSAKIAHVDFHKTPSDFGAQLLESQQIKTLSPLYNRRLRKLKKMYQLRSYLNSQGYRRLEIASVDVSEGIGEDNIGLFRSPRQATKKIESLADEFFLCHKLLGLEPAPSKKNAKPCFRAQLNRCRGACVGEEDTSLYNQRLASALQDYQLQIWPYPGPILLEEKNIDEDEYSTMHLIDNWRYIAKLQDISQLYDYDLAPTQQWGDIKNNTQLQTTVDEVNFDLDIYFILVRFLTNSERMNMNNLKVWPLSRLSVD